MVGGWWLKHCPLYTHIHRDKERVRVGRRWLPGILFFSECGSPCLRQATPCTVAGLGRQTGEAETEQNGLGCRVSTAWEPQPSEGSGSHLRTLCPLLTDEETKAQRGEAAAHGSTAGRWPGLHLWRPHLVTGPSWSPQRSQILVSRPPFAELEQADGGCGLWLEGNSIVTACAAHCRTGHSIERQGVGTSKSNFIRKAS